MEVVNTRARELYEAHRAQIWAQTSRMFAGLMLAQWLAALLFALWISPRAWAGAASRPHLHIYAAVLLGGAITSFPVYLAKTRPTSAFTRHAVATGQLLMSALLIHLSGGRIETHFHVFGSLAFLAFYRDWRVLVTGTVIVVIDHAIRGLFWPQSVYGILAIQPTRFLEHAGWVLFTDFFLIRSICQSLEEMRGIAERQARLEESNAAIERKVAQRTNELKSANEKMLESRRRVERAEKMSALGQLAAGIAHEINNPLGVILGFTQAALKRSERFPELSLPLKSIEREALRCKELVWSLLSFSRSGKAEAELFDFNDAVAATLRVVEAEARIRSISLVRELGPLALFWGNKTQVQQVVVNLCSNALDAVADGGRLAVRTRASRGGGAVLEVQDDGCGIAPEIRDNIFNPFFTTKPVGKGTGLGLSLVYEIVAKHEGSIELTTEVGRGTTFTVSLPVRNHGG